MPLKCTDFFFPTVLFSHGTNSLGDRRQEHPTPILHRSGRRRFHARPGRPVPGAALPGGESIESTLLLFPPRSLQEKWSIRGFGGITCQVDSCVPCSAFLRISFVRGKGIPKASVLGPQTVGGSQAGKRGGINGPSFVKGSAPSVLLCWRGVLTAPSAAGGDRAVMTSAPTLWA